MARASVEAPIWTVEGPEKGLRVRQMFGEIAPKYDLLNSILSMRLHHKWRSIAVDKLGLQPGQSALDVCCGTGDFIAPLRKAIGAGGHVFGLDFSPAMVEIAKTKHDRSTGFLIGDALNLPVEPQRFDGVTVGWGIRNVADIDRAHAEIFRVLKPGGRFVSLDMAQPRNPFVRFVSRALFLSIAPALGALMRSKSAYTYLPKSTERFWSRQKLADSMTRAGFADVLYSDLFFGNVCLHWGVKP